MNDRPATAPLAISFMPTLAYERRIGREASLRSITFWAFVLGSPIAYLVLWGLFFLSLLAHQMWVIGAIGFPTTVIGAAFVLTLIRFAFGAEIGPRLDAIRHPGDFVTIEITLSRDAYTVTQGEIHATHPWSAFERFIDLGNALMLAYPHRRYVLLTRDAVGTAYEDLVAFVSTRVRQARFVDTPAPGSRKR